MKEVYRKKNRFFVDTIMLVIKLQLLTYSKVLLLSVTKSTFVLPLLLLKRSSISYQVFLAQLTASIDAFSLAER